MRRYYGLFALVAAVVLLLSGASAVVLSLYSSTLFWIPLALLLVAVVGTVVCIVRFRQMATRLIRRLASHIDPDRRAALESFPLPLLLLDTNGDVLFSNGHYVHEVADDAAPVAGTSIDRLFPELKPDALTSKSVVDVQNGSHKLTAYISVVNAKEQQRYVVYFVDNTDLKNTAEEYAATRPVVMHICIDNLEEATEHLRAGDRARISGQIETMLEDWITAGGGVLQKYGNERFVVVTEMRHLDAMTADRFSVLDRVRNAFPEAEKNITLSIGVGEGQTIHACRQMARQALDMALSRGGDQVAIKTLNGYDFYGGRSRGVERRTKVRTRIIAQALHELIGDSDRVLVMGHRYSDLDCLGSGAALAMAVRRMNIPAHVVVQRGATMAGRLIDRYEHMRVTDLFIEPSAARERMTKNTLLIIVDTHSTGMLDAPDLYDMAERVVVIDHHRRMVNYIQDAVLTYHEPSSSSACELVAELLPYLFEEKVGRAEAEALLSGIMLDTRNFVLRTGVRTFEAAAYLRSLGADTVTVKKLFSESLEQYQYKSDLVSQAQVYRDTAVAVSEVDYSDYRTAAAQAADDLLSVQGVLASFVVTPIGSQVNISARSFGECNVQLIMETLGGGGHLTMAATQMANATVAEAEAQLKAAIDRYFDQKVNNN